MELSLSLSSRHRALPLPLSPAARSARLRPRRNAPFACLCCSCDSPDGATTRRWFASLLATTAAVGIGVAGGDADAVSTSRRALRSAKVPESEFTTLPNGLKYYDITVGTGAKAVKGSRVAVHYVAKWKGITFMTSRQGLGVGGGTPYGFDIGNSERGNVLKGLDLGVEGMKAGGQRLIIVPPELAYGKKGVQEIPPNATIEMESKKAEGIKNLLLKIVVPLAFPLAGSFIFDLITNSANRHSDIDLSDSSIQLDPSYQSNSIPEEEEEEMESTHGAPQKIVQTENPCSAGMLVSREFSRQASHTEEILAAQASRSSSEISVNRVQDEQRMMEDVDSLKRMVSALEEQAASIESQFHDYCNMKEQESTYQKMQIMCLGMKLEQLESQNQRLEAAATEIRAAAEEFATMRANFDALQSKSKKIWKKNKQDLEAIDGRILAIDAREAEMATRCEGFEKYMEEMKQLTSQLQKDKGSNNENVEVIVERSMRKLSSNKDVLDGLEALRDRWAADMEEMIYLGWITAWLQHDLLVLDGVEVGDTQAIGEPPAQQRKGEKMVAVVAPSNEVELCKASSSASSELRGAAAATEAEASCMMGFAAGGCRKGIIGRPRLLRRLRGWAGGKGRSRRQGKIEFPASPM
uniref:peptidylprolyl isomerase n=1 Tax=Leersia perrieri TaxID=77586 RepID=A0A0D9WWD3_9ORYZ